MQNMLIKQYFYARTVTEFECYTHLLFSQSELQEQPTTHWVQRYEEEN
jgi:hypothetical protein